MKKQNKITKTQVGDTLFRFYNDIKYVYISKSYAFWNVLDNEKKYSFDSYKDAENKVKELLNK